MSLFMSKRTARVEEANRVLLEQFSFVVCAFLDTLGDVLADFVPLEAVPGPVDEVLATNPEQRFLSVPAWECVEVEQCETHEEQ